MSGRGFGIGTISPELCQNPGEIAAFDHIGRVGKASDGVVGIALSIVDIEAAIPVGTRKIEAVVAIGTRRNIQGDSIIRGQVAGSRDYGHDLLHKLPLGRPPKIRRRSRIDPRLCCIKARQRERPHAKPLRAEVGLEGALRKSILIDGIDDF